MKVKEGGQWDRVGLRDEPGLRDKPSLVLGCRQEAAHGANPALAAPAWLPQQPRNPQMEIREQCLSANMRIHR